MSAQVTVRVYGSIEAVKQELVRVLLKKAVKRGDCLICHLAPNKKGYSPIQVGGRLGIKYRAHRLVFEVLNGPIPDDSMVLHTCDTRRCINIDHLYAGTAADNTEDMLSRNRGVNMYREGYGARK